MTAQDAAFQLLQEAGRPMPSRAIAQTALKRGLVRSWSKTPIHSIAQTIEKNIRTGVEPELLSVRGPRGRMIGLPGWDERSVQVTPSEELRVRLPGELIERLELARQAKVGGDIDETTAKVIAAGLAALKAQIQANLAQQLANI